MEFYRKSALSGETYDVFDKDVIKILNPLQSAFYVSRSIPILDVRLSTDNIGRPILVYLFRRSLTKEVFDEWCRQKEKERDSGDKDIRN